MNRPVHFEIQADNTKRAAKFYKDVFGWKIDKFAGLGSEYWIIMTAKKGSKEPGINGGLLPRPAKTPPGQHGTNAYVATMQVASFDNTAKKILAGGGKVAMPKYNLMGMAWQGYFLDTEGNTFGVHEEIKKAKTAKKKK